MKKFIICTLPLLILTALGIFGYFTLVPAPTATLRDPLAEIIPQQLTGWQIQDMDLADSPESSARVSEFLNFDDAIFRIFEQDGIQIGLYIAYWNPGKVSYRWAGAHTPDTCWVVNGWTCLNRQYRVPFNYESSAFEPAEFGIYQKDGLALNVYFWHLVGGKSFSYKQNSTPNILGALIDIKSHGLNLRQEQFFVRLSSNKDLNSLKKLTVFDAIAQSLLRLGLQLKTED